MPGTNQIVYREHDFRARNTRAAPGFTLIELMIVLAILAIVAAFAAPAFNNLIAQNRLTGAAKAFSKGISLARSEAVKRSAPVRFVPTDGSNWGNGWQVLADTDRDGDFSDETPLFSDESIHNSLSLSEDGSHALANSYITFSSLGSLEPLTDSFAVTMKTPGCTFHKMANITTKATGSVVFELVPCIN